MADTKSSLKILFRGKTNLITCGLSNTYEEVISQAISRFGIPKDQRDALILTNGEDYVFEAHLLEYFLLLFPCPEMTFHLRIDWSLMRRSLSQIESRKRKRPIDQDQDQDKADEQKTEEDEEKEPPMQEYKPVPVYRMNCFLGSLPSSGAVPVHRQNSFLREQPQQVVEIPLPRLQDEDLQQQEPLKKRLRLEACGKSRRTASTSVVSPQVPVMRSIRI
ncbi:uncharacterized protein LOC108098075 [Drosophila ficusphila]|uniref:uncharacterized protein LOC108098075 n=1 Tax=Drosophila ficusphila TaxID=30025 RepID=UPI0007E8A5AB|nr:uncharacterized protein LOC108098075 [Drosophila ficusphila]